MPSLTRRSLLSHGLAGAAALPFLAGCAVAADNAVTIRGMAFDPASLTVARGATVTFVNADGPPHTATSDTGAFDTGRLATGSRAALTFSTPGTYPYYCAIHPMMKGVITVA